MRFLVVALAIALITACASTPAVAARLQECDLATEGEVGRALASAFYEPNACYRDCLSSASCEDLAAALCGTSITLLQRCDQRCAHRCSDGALIAVELVCDGVPQCADGADEAGCTTFACGDGVVVSSRARCDGGQSCPNGADEIGCGFFECDSTWGTRLTGSSFRCDGYPHCSDGSDERDCPVHTCADGTTVRVSGAEVTRCDGWTRCFDGSDEEGCAVLTPMCTTP